MKNLFLFLFVQLLLSVILNAQIANLSSGAEDRLYWCRTAYRIAYPIMDALSKNELRKTMSVENTPEPIMRNSFISKFLGEH